MHKHKLWAGTQSLGKVVQQKVVDFRLLTSISEEGKSDPDVLANRHVVP